MCCSALSTASEKRKFKILFFFVFLSELLRVSFLCYLSQMKPKNMCNRFLLWIATDVCEFFLNFDSSALNKMVEKKQKKIFYTFTSPHREENLLAWWHRTPSTRILIYYESERKKIFFILLYKSTFWRSITNNKGKRWRRFG